jgi:peptidyl-tRNA hydrolase
MGGTGVASIIKAVKSEAFPRIRIGVSPATPKGKVKKPTGEEKVVKFLMGVFRPNEKDSIKKMYKKADEALDVLIGEGRQKAMTLFN